MAKFYCLHDADVDIFETADQAQSNAYETLNEWTQEAEVWGWEEGGEVGHAEWGVLVPLEKLVKLGVVPHVCPYCFVAPGSEHTNKCELLQSHPEFGPVWDPKPPEFDVYRYMPVVRGEDSPSASTEELLSLRKSLSDIKEVVRAATKHLGEVEAGVDVRNTLDRISAKLLRAIL